MNMEIDGRIEQLQEKNNYYLIYPLYYPYKKGLFEKAEDYFLCEYKGTYANKICIIIFKILAYYNAYIELTEFFEDPPSPLNNYTPYTNLSDISFNELAKLIKVIITDRGSTMNIYLTELDTLISIGNEFSTVIYVEDQNFISNLKTLVNLEGLHLLEY